jgi:chromosome segregation ATPase
MKTGYQVLEKIDSHLRDYQKMRDDTPTKLSATQNQENELTRVRKELKEKEKTLKDRIRELEDINNANQETIDGLRNDLGDKDITIDEYKAKLESVKTIEDGLREDLEERDREINELKVAKRAVENKLNETNLALNQEKK